MSDIARHSGLYRDTIRSANALKEGVRETNEWFDNPPKEIAGRHLIYDFSGRPDADDLTENIIKYAQRRTDVHGIDFNEIFAIHDHVLYGIGLATELLRRDLPPIPDKSLQSATPDELLEEYCEKKGVPVDQRLEMKGAVSQLAERTTSGTWQEREKARRSLPTADVELPDSPPELWQDSQEKAQAEAGEIKLDDAIIGFTQRVYRDYLPGHCPVGMAITDYKDSDGPFYDQWVGLKKRINGRVDKTWPDEFPFPSRAARNDFILEQVQAGVLLPPSNQRVYQAVKSAIWNRHQVNLNDYLPKQATAR